jgi:hypothetical protein
VPIHTRERERERERESGREIITKISGKKRTANKKTVYVSSMCRPEIFKK